MKVCIAEKPSVAKEIASVIGAKIRKDGYFEEATVVINCGDAGQEGELIQRWVIKQANYKGKVERLWISSLTTEAIKSGFNNLQPSQDFDNLYYAGSSRAIGDWLLGMNATRLYTLKYGGYKQVLSIGRVQTPTLAMLVNRHLEITQFVPKPYWELQTLYRDTKFNCTEGKFLKKEDSEKLLIQVLNKDLTIVNIEKKEGKEYAPKLFDLTSLQVYSNNKFGFTAEATLKLVQGLYEKKAVSYPRVDTTFLPNDLYPKIPGILQGLSNYSNFTQTLIGKKIKKSSKIFNDSKVTDHHAIIPTGEQKHLGTEEQKVYDIIVRRFLAVFYPDCKVAKTTVMANVEDVEFSTKGKVVLEEGWRVLFPKEKKNNEEEDKENEEERILPNFITGESGPHTPSINEKITKPPKNYTEASLLRAMETAGKQVENEELRDLMKANGIGRPSTRANIIETLFKRKYARRNKKQVLPTEMGIELVQLIQNRLLKSAELTGQWEKQLKEIEQGEFKAQHFIFNMKKMVDSLVQEVKSERQNKKLSLPPSPTNNNNKKSKSKPKSNEPAVLKCPKCNNGNILTGKTSYGCSQWKAGCNMRIPFKYLEKKLTDKQVQRLIEKGSTTKIKGFKLDGKKAEGIISLNENFELSFENKTPAPKSNKNEMPLCPKCGKGNIIKGQAAYGCTAWKSGCNFRYSFEEIRIKAKGQPLTKELVLEIIKN